MYSVEIVKEEEKKVVGLALHTTFTANRQAEEIPPFFHKVMEDGTLENVPNQGKGKFEKKETWKRRGKEGE
jgi:predicted transcriptional regulator YdeE